jgi:hypothetical protein
MSSRRPGGFKTFKGQGKMKYFCQMCSKQCKDANGFKCHQTTEGHRAQMKLFLEDPQKYIEEFSDSFEEAFLIELGEASDDWRVASELLSTVMRGPDNVRLNATKWKTLSDFLQYIESEGLVELKPDPDRPTGYMVRRLDPGREERIAKAMAEEKRKLEREQERTEREFEKRIKLTQAFVGDKEGGFSEATKVSRSEGTKKIALSLGVGGIKKPAIFKQSEIEEKSEKSSVARSILVDCVVKVKDGSHAGVKGRVLSGSTDSVGGIELESLKTGEKLRQLSPQDLETVIPNIQKRVRVVSNVSPWKGLEGILIGVDTEAGTGNVFFGSLNESKDLPFDDICKLAVE